MRIRGSTARRTFGVAAVLMLVACVPACASAYMTTTGERLEPTPDAAVVRFLHPEIGGQVVTILDGKAAIGNSHPGSQFDYLAAPGEHLFIAAKRARRYLKANLVAGRTYYVVVSGWAGSPLRHHDLAPAKSGSDLLSYARRWERELPRKRPDPERFAEWSAAQEKSIQRFVDAYRPDAPDQPTLDPGDGQP